MHNQDNVSIPRKFLKTKYSNIATPTAKDEKMNCLIDSPKNIDSLKSLISLLIFISIYLIPPPISFIFVFNCLILSLNSTFTHLLISIIYLCITSLAFLFLFVILYAKVPFPKS